MPDVFTVFLNKDDDDDDDDDDDELDMAKNFTFALEASLLGQIFISRTISQPRTLSAVIQTA